MRTHIVTAAVIGLMSASAALAQSTTGPIAQTGKAMGNRPECTASFRALDRNRDGKLDEAELSGAALPTNVSRQPNGQVSEVDFVSACSSQTPLGRSDNN